MAGRMSCHMERDILACGNFLTSSEVNHGTKSFKLEQVNSGLHQYPDTPEWNRTTLQHIL